MPGEMDLEDAMERVRMLVILGRAIPYEQWSEEAAMVRRFESQRQANESLF